MIFRRKVWGAGGVGAAEIWESPENVGDDSMVSDCFVLYGSNLGTAGRFNDPGTLYNQLLSCKT